ncbi:MAG: HAD-IIA family hydrolase [Fimbriimonadaceae bacterium]|jgi:4-nitrophenyl phosphatase|nr:HAD-IIA family hydrolase [Fimbriimonadaceae bacterium]
MTLPALLLDLDGTVYRGSEPCPYACDALWELHNTGHPIRYLTNNSAARPEKVAEKCLALGIPCEPSWVYGTGQGAAKLCSESGYSTVLAVGMDPLFQTLRDHGLSLVTEANDKPDAVIVGICRSFAYDHIRQAMRAILGGAPFIATNRDTSFPMEEGKLDPGAGTMVAAIEAGSGVSPLVVGKPSPLLVNQALRDLGIQPHQAMMVGDRVDTDIAAGLSAGTETWLVLTGVTKELGELSGSDDLRGLVEFLRNSSSFVHS